MSIYFKKLLFYLKLHVINSANLLLHIDNIILTGHKEVNMLPTAFGFPEDMSYRSVLALEIQGFS